MVILNEHDPGQYLKMLFDGSALKCDLYFRYQDSTPGPGATLLAARSWVGCQDFVVMLGDGIYFVPIQLAGKEAPHMFVMPLDGFDDPKKYGQVTVPEGRGKVASIFWKPGEMMSNLIQTTCFVLPADAFERLERLGKKRNCEFNITALTEEYVNEGKMEYSMLPPRSFIDCGTVDALLTAQVRRWEVVNGRKWS